MVTFKLAQWWEPHAPAHRLAGTLFETEPGIFRLIVDGHFGQPPIAANAAIGVPVPVNPSLDDIPILLGVTSDDKFVTLIDCFVLRASGLPGFTKTSQEISPRMIAYDVHFQTADDFRLRSISMRYSNLDQWVATSGFKVEFPSSQAYAVSVQYEKPEPVTAALSNGLSVGVLFSAEGPALSAPQSEIRIQQAAWPDVSAPDERSYEELMRTLTMVSDLISLGVGQPVRPIECEASALKSGGSQDPPTTVRFRLHHNSEPIAPFKGHVDAVEMMFLFKDVRDRFDAVLEAWCLKQETIKPLYDLYFGTLRSPKMYVEHRFLNMFQALEAFDRRNFQARPEIIAKHELRKERILASVQSKKDRDWLKGRLRYSHEPRATERLRRLVTTFDADWIFQDAAKEIELAGNLRNFLTHYDDKLALKLPPPKELPRAMHNLAVRFQLVCEVILLQQIGFKSADLKRQMQSTRRLERRLAK